MIINFSPKKQFQENTEVARELATVVQSGNFHIALSSALSEYSFRRTPTAEQIVAVREFISILLQLPFEDQPLPSLQIPTLDRSVYERHYRPPGDSKTTAK